jgi:hypothetical protein
MTMKKEPAVTDEERIVYQLTVEDLQNVADEELSRKLTEEEIKMVEDKLGDYIKWYEAIGSAIANMLHETSRPK